ncbi:MAG: hypothetical protein ABSH56_32300 [Bryobacteraceae bacterium]|jgi:hypothetical protein
MSCPPPFDEPAPRIGDGAFNELSDPGIPLFPFKENASKMLKKSVSTLLVETKARLDVSAYARK